MCNVGKIDRIIRSLLGIILIVVSLFMGNVIVGILGAIALATAAMSFCPLYTLLKLNTGCQVKS